MSVATETIFVREDQQTLEFWKTQLDEVSELMRLTSTMSSSVSNWSLDVEAFRRNQEATGAHALPLSCAFRSAPRLRNEFAVRLISQWLADESGYDEQAWQRVESALKENRLSTRNLFHD